MDGSMGRLMPLKDLLAELPGGRGTGGVCVSTGVRWCTRGFTRPDGTVIRLRAVRVGTRWCSKPEWLEEFLTAMTAAHLPPVPETMTA